MPPWTEVDDLPLPTWSELGRAEEEDDERHALFAGPGAADDHRWERPAWRAVSALRSEARKGKGVAGDGFLIRPVRSRGSARTSPISLPTSPALPPVRTTDDGLPYRYFFVGHEGASGFSDLDRALDDAPDAGILDPGFAVAVVEERSVQGERWVRTRSGYWVRAHDVREAHSSTFRGAEILEDGSSPGPAESTRRGVGRRGPRENEYAEPHEGKSVAVHARFDRVRWREEHPAPGGIMIRVSEDGAPSRWMRAKDPRRTRRSRRPLRKSRAPIRASAGSTSSSRRKRSSRTKACVRSLPPWSRAAAAPPARRPRRSAFTASGSSSSRATPWINPWRTTTRTSTYSIEDVPYVRRILRRGGRAPRRVLARRLRPSAQPRVREPRSARRPSTALRLHVPAPAPAGWSAIIEMRFEEGGGGRPLGPLGVGPPACRERHDTRARRIQGRRIRGAVSTKARVSSSPLRRGKRRHCRAFNPRKPATHARVGFATLAAAALSVGVGWAGVPARRPRWPPAQEAGLICPERRSWPRSTPPSPRKGAVCTIGFSCHALHAIGRAHVHVWHVPGASIESRARFRTAELHRVQAAIDDEQLYPIARLPQAKTGGVTCMTAGLHLRLPRRRNLPRRTVASRTWTSASASPTAPWRRPEERPELRLRGSSSATPALPAGDAAAAADSSTPVDSASPMVDSSVSTHEGGD